jgi:hypothetical protein
MIERLLALGARRADMGRPAQSPGRYRTDPEENEFCVLRLKETLTR